MVHHYSGQSCTVQGVNIYRVSSDYLEYMNAYYDIILGVEQHEGIVLCAVYTYMLAIHIMCM